MFFNNKIVVVAFVISTSVFSDKLCMGTEFYRFLQKVGSCLFSSILSQSRFSGIQEPDSPATCLAFKVTRARLKYKFSDSHTNSGLVKALVSFPISHCADIRIQITLPDESTLPSLSRFGKTYSFRKNVFQLSLNKKSKHSEIWIRPLQTSWFEFVMNLWYAKSTYTLFNRWFFKYVQRKMS